MPHPSTSSAYGIWSLNEVRDAVRGDNWPTEVAGAVIQNPEATTSNTTAGSIRSGSTLADFFSFAYGVFGSHVAGENLTTDFGGLATITQVTYKNNVGGTYAPTFVWIQSSDDGTNWTTRLNHSDNNSSNLQTLTITGGTAARYWRMYQATNTRQNQAGYEWHFGSYTMTG